MDEKITVLPDGTTCFELTGCFYANKCKFPLGATGIVIVGNENECNVYKSRIVGKNVIIGDYNTNENGHFSTIKGSWNVINGMSVTIESGLKNTVNGTVTKDNGSGTILRTWKEPASLSGCDYATKVACDQFDLPIETAQAMTDNQILAYIAMMTKLPIDFFSKISVAPSHSRKRDRSDESVRKPHPYATMAPDTDTNEDHLCAVCKGYLRTCVVIHEDTNGDSTACLCLCPNCAVTLSFKDCPMCRRPTKRIARVGNLDEEKNK